MDKSNSRKELKLKKITPYLLILPMLLLYFTFIGGGLIEILKESLGFLPEFGFHKISIESFSYILHSESFIRNCAYSLYLAGVSAIISTILGIITAYCFITSKNRYLKKIANRVIQLGVILPYLYVILIAVLLLTRTGIISRIFYNLRLIKNFSEFPELVYNSTGLSILWVYIFKGTPFIALFLMNVMGKINDKYSGLGKTLGASNPVLLNRIYIPLCSKAIIWASSIIFAYDLGAFEAPYILSGSSPVPLSSSLYSMFINPDLSYIPRAMAMNLIVFVLGFIVVVIYGVILKLIFMRRLK